MHPFDPAESEYVEGQPYHVTLAEWDDVWTPEEIDRKESYWPYTRGSGAGQGLIPAPQQSERSDAAPIPLGASPARIPDPHLTPAQHDPEGD